ncbi:MAG: insulinase family protein [Lachnospiraceae bacterium]|nr:insulinase family protein [Lachnospiraceae bacterium]
MNETKRKAIEACKAYEIVEEKEIGDLHSDGLVLRHKKTGARIALLANDDDNKVFFIGFRTPPENSTGVAHIIEHTVLCGSENFPVKDPFIELVKGSLNTFLNAMTYPDKTMYPVASCNEKDFQNLMHVYLDAVFYPNIYKEEKIFRQEGWHYEMESVDDPLTINGVVYNEMKGAFSSPDDVLSRVIMNSLYPDTTYGLESGGDPDVIPELSYEEYLNFHRRYYHPSNSYIYLYGDMDMAEKLEYLDKEYLSHFENQPVDSAVIMQKPFTAVKEVAGEYPISDTENEQDNTYLAYNMSVGDCLDRELYVAFQILDYALCSAPGAPLRQKLIDLGIGKDVYSDYDNGILQPYFSIISKGANADQKELFIKTVTETLQDLVKNKVDRKALFAGINYYEFKYREADFGHYPKGLMYGLQMMDSWLYDDEKPFRHIEANDTYAFLRKQADSDYYEKLIQEYLLDNPHKSVVVITPSKGMTEKKDSELARKLAERKAAMTEAEVEAVVAETKALHQYQEEPSRKEDLEKIPLLTRADMRKDAEQYVNEERNCGDTLVLYHNLFTNGIVYLRLIFDCKQVPEKLFPYLGLLKAVMGLLDTENYSYGEFFNEMNMQTGGLSVVTNTYADARDTQKVKLTLECKAKVLSQNLPQAFALLEEMMFTSKFNDHKRLKELLEESLSKMQANMMSAGHSLALERALSYISMASALNEQMSGIPFYQLLEDCKEHFTEKKAEISAALQELISYIFRPENLMVDFTGDEKDYENLSPLCEALQSKLFTMPVSGDPYKVTPEKKNEGLMSASQVQYVCRAGNFRHKGLPYTGALRVLKVMMGYDYLWNNVRVKGGAYGCMSGFSKSGDCYFLSYRDPNLEKTIDIYEKAADYIANFQADERTMTQFIIGAISDLDTPMTPATKALYSLGGYMTHLSYEALQKEREELLAADAATIRDLSKYIRAFMDDECLCVVGNEEKIKQAKNLFQHTEYLFH